MSTLPQQYRSTAHHVFRTTAQSRRLRHPLGHVRGIDLVHVGPEPAATGSHPYARRRQPELPREYRTSRRTPRGVRGDQRRVVDPELQRINGSRWVAPLQRFMGREDDRRRVCARHLAFHGKVRRGPCVR